MPKKKSKVSKQMPDVNKINTSDADTQLLENFVKALAKKKSRKMPRIKGTCYGNICRAGNLPKLPEDFMKDPSRTAKLVEQAKECTLPPDTMKEITTLSTASPDMNSTFDDPVKGIYTPIQDSDVQKTMEMSKDADKVCGPIPGQVYPGDANRPDRLSEVIKDIPVRVLNTFLGTGLEWMDASISPTETTLRYKSNMVSTEISYEHEQCIVHIHVELHSESTYSYERSFNSAKEMSEAGVNARRLLNWFVSAVNTVYRK